jgi:hypothetical protein
VQRLWGVGVAVARKGRKAKVQMRMVSSILVEGFWLLRYLCVVFES